MMNFLENKFSPAKRLYHLRHTVCHNRLIFCERHAISPHTLSTWEKGKKPVTEKGANKLIEAFAKEGILCSVEWLLHGVGLSPTTLEDFTSSIKIEEISIIEKHKNANPEDLNLIKIVDTEDEIVEILDNFYKKYNLSPNF